MSALNRALTATADLVLAPLAWVPAMVGLALVAFSTALVALLVIQRTSDQPRLRAAKNGMYAALLEMRLFNDDLGAILRAQVDVFRWNARYLRASLVPLVWLALPFALLLPQLDAFYAYRGLSPNTPVLVTAHVRPGQTHVAPAVTLQAPDGIRADTPAEWFPATGDVLWRIVPERPVDGPLLIHVGSTTITKSVDVSDRVGRRSALRPAMAWRAELEAPSESPLPADSPFDRIAVAYPPRDLTLAGWPVPWWVVYGGFTILFGLALSRLLGVEV